MNPLVDEGMVRSGSAPQVCLGPSRQLSGGDEQGSWWYNTNWFRNSRDPQQKHQKPNQLFQNFLKEYDRPRFAAPSPPHSSSTTATATALPAEPAPALADNAGHQPSAMKTPTKLKNTKKQQQKPIGETVRKEEHGEEKEPETDSEHAITTSKPVFKLTKANTSETLAPSPIITPPRTKKREALGSYLSHLGGFGKLSNKITECICLPLFVPQIFKVVGASPARGILLSGPLGVGKSVLLDSLVSYTQASLYSISAPELLSREETISLVDLSTMFTAAQKNEPSIVFIDEIDLLTSTHHTDDSSNLIKLRNNLKNELDTLSSSKANVIFIGATSAPETVDVSFRRYGRLDREIALPKPDHAGRIEILKQLTSGMKIASDVNLERISDRTQGFVAADLCGLCGEAVFECIREFNQDNNGILQEIEDDEKNQLYQRLVVFQKHFEAALKSIIPSSMRDVHVSVPDISWQDIGGIEEIRKTLTECVEQPLRRRDLYQKYGMSPVSGVLMYGPPGCGKSLIAKAIASQAKHNFISVKGPELLSSYVGQSEANVRKLFEKAKQNAPCIIFFDEIDSLARKRGMSSDQTSDRILNQLLCEMDGFNSIGSNGSAYEIEKRVFVIAATNRPELVDSALLRPGRFDQLIHVTLPTPEGRLSILRALLRNTPLATDVNLEDLARRAKRFSGADLAALCQHARGRAIAKECQQKMDTDAELQPSDPSPLVKEQFEEGLKKIVPSVSFDEYKKSLLFQQSTQSSNPELQGDVHDMRLQFHVEQTAEYKKKLQRSKAETARAEQKLADSHLLNRLLTQQIKFQLKLRKREKTKKAQLAADSDAVASDEIIVTTKQ